MIKIFQDQILSQCAENTERACIRPWHKYRDVCVHKRTRVCILARDGHTWDTSNTQAPAGVQKAPIVHDVYVRSNAHFTAICLEFIGVFGCDFTLGKVFCTTFLTPRRVRFDFFSSAFERQQLEYNSIIWYMFNLEYNNVLTNYCSKYET